MIKHANNIMLPILIVLLLIPGITLGFTFEYSYGDPYLATSQTYIDSVENAVLRSEGSSYRYWKSNVGNTTFANTTPGVINYHFDFGAMGYTDAISEISLGVNMPIFKWSYSQGHNIFFGSKDGSTWEKMAEVSFAADAALGSYLPLGAITIPDSLLGGSDLWFKAEMYSFGQSAANGGVLTNTAQLSRYDPALGYNTFSLGVNFASAVEPPSAVPEPSTLLLLGSGLVGLVWYGRKRKNT